MRENVLCLAAQLRLPLCNPIDCSPPGSSVQGDSPGKNTGVGLPCPPTGDLLNPETEPRSPSLQAHSLLFWVTEKPALYGGWIPVTAALFVYFVWRECWGLGCTWVTQAEEMIAPSSDRASLFPCLLRTLPLNKCSMERTLLWTFALNICIIYSHTS